MATNRPGAKGVRRKSTWAANSPRPLSMDDIEIGYRVIEALRAAVNHMKLEHANEPLLAYLAESLRISTDVKRHQLCMGIAMLMLDRLGEDYGLVD